MAEGAPPIRIGFVVHVMQVAGAEVLVAETIRRLGPRLVPVVICLDALGPLGEDLRARGVPVEVLDRRPGLDLRMAAGVRAAIARHGLQVLHAHQYTPFFYAALGAKVPRRRARLVFTEHGRHWPDVVSRQRRLLNRLVFHRLADVTTGVSAFSVRALVEQDGFPPGSVSVVENGIDIARYAFGRDRSALSILPGFSADRRYVGCVARFHPVKDHRTLIDAFAHLCQGRHDVDLILVGDGPLRGALEAQVRAAGLASRVHFLGVRRDVASILAALDAFALASVSEAAPLTVLEAMATGTPVVTTDVGGAAEMVRQDREGLLVPRGDALAMSRALAWVLDHPERAAQMGARGAARVRETYTLDQTVQRYYDVYLRLTSSGGDRGVDAPLESLAARGA